MTRRLRSSLLIILAVGLASIFYGYHKRPHELVSLAVLPDEKTIAVHGKTSVHQHITAPTDSISGIAFRLDEASLSAIPPEAPIFLHIIATESGQEIRTVHGSWRELYSVQHLMYRDENTALDEKIPLLKIPFVLITKAKGMPFEFVVEAPTLTQSTALKFAYQHDDTKFSQGNLFIGTDQKPGALSFALYERPTILTRHWRWLAHPDHLVAWLGLGLIAGSLVAHGLLKIIKTPSGYTASTPVDVWHQVWQNITYPEIVIACLVSFLATLIVYWPALQLFFFQDDINILLRVTHLNSLARLIFTNHPFLLAGETATFSIGFFRPISYSLIPWLFYQLFGLAAPVHHLAHLALFSLVTTSTYFFARLFLERTAAALTSILWLTHSSKLPIALWLSSMQDIAAALFFMAALLFHTRQRSRTAPGHPWVIWLLYLLALYAKDYAILLPAAILLIEFAANIQERKLPWRHWLYQQFQLQVPLIALSGFYLLTRTMALGDPTLPLVVGHDPSYDLTVNPLTILRNLFIYTTWTFEGLVHPELFLLFLTALVVLWHQKHKNLYLAIMVGLAWWVLLILPNLFLANEQNSRWLTLSTLGSSLVISLLVWHFLPGSGRIKKGLAVALSLIVLCVNAYSYRQPVHLQNYLSISDEARSVIQQYTLYQNQHGRPQRIIFADIPPEKRGTINLYLLHLFFADAPIESTYCSTPCENLRSNDVILTIGIQQ